MKKCLAVGCWLLTALPFFSLSVNALQASQQRLFTEGMERLHARNYVLAENLLSQFLMDAGKEDRNRSEALLGFGVASLKNGKWDQAAQALLDLQEADAGSPWADEGLYWRGLCRYMQGDCATAEKLLAEFLALPPSPPLFGGSQNPHSQRYEALIYRSWSLYKLNQKEAAFQTIREGLSEGLSLDFRFSLFSLAADLALSLKEYAFLEAAFADSDFESFSEAEKRKVDFYRAELKRQTEGDDAAYPYYRKAVEFGGDWELPFVRAAWKQLLKTDEAHRRLDAVNQSVAEIAASVGVGEPSLRPILWRTVALNLQAKQIKAALALSSPYLEANPFDFRMWSYHLEALTADDASVTVEKTLPTEVFNALIDGKAAHPFGDYVWNRRLNELAHEKEWDSCQREAETMLRLYPQSEFYWNALYASVFSSAVRRFYGEARLHLQENRPFRDEKARWIRLREANPLCPIEPPHLYQLMLLEGVVQKAEQNYEAAFQSFLFLAAPTLLSEAVYSYREGETEETSSPKTPAEPRPEALSEATVGLLYNTGVTAFQTHRYDRLREVADLFDRRLTLQTASPAEKQSVVLLHYYTALSFIAEKEYASAKEWLLPLENELKAVPEAAFLLPWVLYYLGWVAYREGDYAESYRRFLLLRQQFPQFEKDREAHRLLAWSALSDADYGKAAEAFLAFAQGERGTEKDFALFQAGRSYHLGKHFALSREQLLPLAQRQGSPYADDALMELAAVAFDEGQFQAASDTYLQMGERFPDSPLSEEAAFLAADSLFVGGKFAEAAELYASYKQHWPKGYNYQAALYRGAAASVKTGDFGAAAFLYTRLHQQFPESPFHADALLGLAELAMAKEEWTQAKEWYQLLQSLYPQEAKAIQVADRLKSLYFRIQGRNNEEAALWVDLEEGGGVRTRRGRKAALQLANLYINLYRNSEHRTAALGWLREIADKKDDYPKDALSAFRLLGDDAFKEGRLKEAVDCYVQGASLSADSEAIGSLLYKALQVTLESGSSDDALTVYRTLRKRGPGGLWLTKANQLPGLQRLLAAYGTEEGQDE